MKYDFLIRVMEEDIDDGKDITSSIILDGKKVKCEAVIYARERCVIAGSYICEEFLKYYKLKYEIKKRDGEWVDENETVIYIFGDAYTVLMLERTLLNFLMRLSGIATITKKIVDKCKDVNPNVKIAATRKTTPGMRLLEKKAVVAGGGVAHRMGLYDAVLIKDNHYHFFDDMCETIEKFKKRGYEKVEIEVKTREDAIKAAKCGADIIMLDNMSVDDAKYLYPILKEYGVIVEISGGINFENVVEYAPYADIISLGIITHSIKAIDITMDIVGVVYD